MEATYGSPPSRLVGELHSNKVTILFVLHGPMEVEAITTSSFVTRTETVTVTSIEKTICAKLINVTAACRRRRNFEFEKPEILTFDEDIDEDIDLVFRNFYKQFVPTKTLSMEVTPLVVMPPRVSSGRNPSIVSPPSRLQSSYPVFHPLGSRNKSPYLHPSLYYQQDESKFRQQQLQQQHRIFFSALSLANLFSRTTVTFTTFTTETKTKVSTSSASFFVVGCTPNPFPFSVCPAKR